MDETAVFKKITAQVEQNAAMRGFDQNALTEQEKPGAESGPGTDEPSLRRLLTVADLENMPLMEWLIEGIFPAEGVGCMYGDSASGKSFLAIDLAAHVAEGSPWFGLAVIQRPVVYVAFEGRGGFKRRTTAWQIVNRKEYPAAFFLDFNPADLLKPADVALMAKSYPKGSLVIIDTLAQSQSGDENSTKDMGTFNRACCDLKDRVGGPLLLIHHRGKDSSKGLRGSSSLLGALDVTIEVTFNETTGIRSWKVAKNKEGASGQKFAFRLEKVVIEPNNLGGDTSCAVVPCEPTPAGKEDVICSLKGNQSIVYNCYRKILQDKPKSAYGVTKQELKDAFYKEYAANTKEGKSPPHTAFYDAHKALIAKGLLTERDETFFLPDVTPETSPLPEEPQPVTKQEMRTGQEGSLSQLAQSA